MHAKTTLIILTLLAGCFAAPEPSQDSPEDGSSSGESTSSNEVNAVSTPYLVNGTTVRIGRYPYMGALTVSSIVKSFLCGASLISQRTVLTAAHCIDVVYKNGELHKSLRVVLGTIYWKTGGISYEFERNVTHPHYVRARSINDIGLLITTTSVILSNLVQPVQLTFDYIGTDVRCVVTGWGKTASNSTGSPVLLQIRIKTIEGQQCVDDISKISKAPPIETALQICTYDSLGLGVCKSTRIQTCETLYYIMLQGDSGGPMVRRDDHVQIGIVSWGFPCAVGLPDVFTRVSAYKEFIESNIVE